MTGDAWSRMERVFCLRVAVGDPLRRSGRCPCRRPEEAVTAATTRSLEKAQALANEQGINQPFVLPIAVEIQEAVEEEREALRKLVADHSECFHGRCNLWYRWFKRNVGPISPQPSYYCVPNILAAIRSRGDAPKGEA